MKFVETYAGSSQVRATFWVAALFALVMALLPHPPELPIEPSDKVQHAIAFITLGLLGGYSYPRLSTLKLIGGLSFYGALIEVLQAIPMLHRDSDPLDWITDTVACTVAVIALRWWRGRRA